MPPGHTLFVGHIFDGTESFEGSVEVDAEGVIVAVERGPREETSGAIEIGDGTLLPGLIDLHTHLTASGGMIRTVPVDDHEPNLKALLRNGVTSALHLGGMARVAFEVRRRERDGEITSPRLFAVGPFLDPPGSSHCGGGLQQLDHCLTVASPEAATAAVEALERAYGPDLIKITHDSGFPERRSNPYDDATLRAILAAAGTTTVVAHIRNTVDIDTAVAAGVPVITHLPLDERFDAAQAAPWVAAGTRFIPTIALFGREQAIALGTFDFDDPTLALDAPEAAIEEVRGLSYTPEQAARVTEVRENVLHNFRSLLEAGAVVLAGTDAGVPGSFHGRTMVEELEEMVSQGMATEAALVGATSRAADLLGRPDLGRIAVGATADLLLVDGDPLADVSNLRRVRSVYLGGALVDRGALEVNRGVSLERDPSRLVDDAATCLRTSECEAAETCSRLYRCSARCESSADCAAEEFCAADIAGGRACYPSIGCDLIAQNCANGTACVPMSNGATWCASAGEASAGAECDGTTLQRLCARGLYCNGGTCEQLCAVGGAGCPAGQGCASVEAETGVDVGTCR